MERPYSYPSKTNANNTVHNKTSEIGTQPNRIKNGIELLEGKVPSKVI